MSTLAVGRVTKKERDKEVEILLPFSSLPNHCKHARQFQKGWVEMVSDVVRQSKKQSKAR